MSDELFRRELRIFLTEAQAGTQFFYSYLVIHALASGHRQIDHTLNDAPLLWGTILGALQTSTIVALGRVFDQNKSAHSLKRLLTIAEHNPQIFSKAALRRRRRGNDAKPPEWLDDFLARAYEPTAEDFCRLKGHVEKRRGIYEKNYRALRHKLFAHKQVSDHKEVRALMGKTNIRELQRLLVFLLSLHDALLELFENGRKPVLRPQPYSVKAMLKASGLAKGCSVQEMVIRQAREYFLQRVRSDQNP
jgi:hypothetical protein